MSIITLNISFPTEISQFSKISLILKMIDPVIFGTADERSKTKSYFQFKSCPIIVEAEKYFF